jgi:hypothetical protein
VMALWEIGYCEAKTHPSSVDVLGFGKCPEELE